MSVAPIATQQTANQQPRTAVQDGTDGFFDAPRVLSAFACVTLPDVGTEFSFDENVRSLLPAGSQVLETKSYGASAWTRTARIQVRLSDGSTKLYFMKCATEGGDIMMRGEFQSLSAIHEVLPGFVPQPQGWGKFRDSTPSTYFFLMDFHHFSHDLPDPNRFTTRITELHRKSASPTGQFGFHVPTCKGKMVQNTAWSHSWAEVFTRLIRDLHEIEVAVNGAWPEYEKAFQQLCDVVIPQLLGALQEDGRVLKPCLIHGDMWEENVATDLETREPIVYDCSSLYAHNEFELGHWRRDGSRLGKNYIRQYLRKMPPSEPVEQWEDRTRLYAMEFNISHMLTGPAHQHLGRGTYSAPHVQIQLLTKISIYDKMLYFNEKYPGKDASSKIGEPVGL